MKKKSFLDDNSTANLNPNMKIHPNPFPRKMALAIDFLEKNGLPPKVKPPKKRKKPLLTPLQAELLNFFSHNPTEKQMFQLKDFLNQLLKDENYTIETKQKVIAA